MLALTRWRGLTTRTVSDRRHLCSSRTGLANTARAGSLRCGAPWLPQKRLLSLSLPPVLNVAGACGASGVTRGAAIRHRHGLVVITGTQGHAAVTLTRVSFTPRPVDFNLCTLARASVQSSPGSGLEGLLPLPLLVQPMNISYLCERVHMYITHMHPCRKIHITSLALLQIACACEPQDHECHRGTLKVTTYKSPLPESLPPPMRRIA